MHLQLVRSPYRRILTITPFFHIRRIFSFYRTLLNKASIHLIFIFICLEHFCSYVVISWCLFIFLIWRVASLIFWHVVSPFLICSCCLCPLLAGHVSYVSYLFRTVWTYPFHVCSWSIASTTIPLLDYCCASEIYSCDIFCFLIYCAYVSLVCCFLRLF